MHHFACEDTLDQSVKIFASLSMNQSRTWLRGLTRHKVRNPFPPPCSSRPRTPWPWSMYSLNERCLNVSQGAQRFAARPDQLLRSRVPKDTGDGAADTPKSEAFQHERMWLHWLPHVCSVGCHLGCICFGFLFAFPCKASIHSWTWMADVYVVDVIDSNGRSYSCLVFAFNLREK